LQPTHPFDPDQRPLRLHHRLADNAAHWRRDQCDQRLRRPEVPGRRTVFRDTTWQFGYQAIAGLRYDINPLLALDLDYRYLATTEPTFSIPNTALHYRSSVNTNNFVASLTYRFGPP
jgi:opacity protein-like surface antigen